MKNGEKKITAHLFKLLWDITPKYQYGWLVVSLTASARTGSNNCVFIAKVHGENPGTEEFVYNRE